MKKLVVVLAVALLGAGIGAVYLWREMDALHDRVASLQSRVQAMETAKPAAPLMAQVKTIDTIMVPAVTAQLPATREAAATPKNPAMPPAMMRAVMEQMYPDLGQELGLAPDELDKFFDLLASGADKTAMQAMLGSRYAQFQEYQQTLLGRQQVNQLRGELAASGSALPEAQARPLMAALNAEQLRIAQDAMKNRQLPAANPEEERERQMQIATENTRRMVEAAAPHLNAQQLESYRQMLSRQTQMMGSFTQRMDVVARPSSTQN